jgi:hypothetical protein
MTYRGLSKTVLAIVEVEFLIDNISQLGVGRSLPRIVEDAKRSSWRGAAECNSRRVDPALFGIGDAKYSRRPSAFQGRRCQVLFLARISARRSQVSET